jgi:hypothetical protein
MFRQAAGEPITNRGHGEVEQSGDAPGSEAFGT